MPRRKCKDGELVRNLILLGIIKLMSVTDINIFNQ